MNGDIKDRMPNFMVSSEIDPTVEIIEDNRDINNGFSTSNSGDIPINIQQDMYSDTVSGDVLFNQAGNCTARKI